MKKYLLMMLMGMTLCSFPVWAEVVEGNQATEEQRVEYQVDNKMNFKKKHHADFVKRLNLTDEQKEKAKALREKNKPQMEEIFSKMKELRKQASEIRAQNQKEFESILTQEQKETLETMKKEHHDKIKLKKHKK